MTFFIFILLNTSLLFKFATKFFLHVVPSFQTPCQCYNDRTTLKKKSEHFHSNFNLELPKLYFLWMDGNILVVIGVRVAVGH